MGYGISDSGFAKAPCSGALLQASASANRHSHNLQIESRFADGGAGCLPIPNPESRIGELKA